MRFSTGFAARGRSSLAFHTNATSSTGAAVSCCTVRPTFWALHAFVHCSQHHSCHADSTKVHEQERSARNNQRDRSRELNSAVDVPPLESSVNGKSQLHRATIFGNQGPKQISLLEQLGNDGEGASSFECVLYFSHRQESLRPSVACGVVMNGLVVEVQ